jgi:hypothetical protein
LIINRYEIENSDVTQGGVRFTGNDIHAFVLTAVGDPIFCSAAAVSFSRPIHPDSDSDSGLSVTLVVSELFLL